MNGNRGRSPVVLRRGGRPPLRGVSFDATGTLIACPRRSEIYAEVLARHGLELPVADLERGFLTAWKEFECRLARGEDRYNSHPEGARGFWGELLERMCLLLECEPPGPFAAAELFARFERADAWELRPGCREVLPELRRRGLRVAVTSNWDRRLPRVLANLGLGRRLDAVVCSEEVGSAKPAEPIFLAACRELDLEPASVLHVGDAKIEDREGALAAGLEALWLNPARGDIGSLAEVLDHLPR